MYAVSEEPLSAGGNWDFAEGPCKAICAGKFHYSGFCSWSAPNIAACSPPRALECNASRLQCVHAHADSCMRTELKKADAPMLLQYHCREGNKAAEAYLQWLCKSSAEFSWLGFRPSCAKGEEKKKKEEERWWNVCLASCFCKVFNRTLIKSNRGCSCLAWCMAVRALWGLVIYLMG